MPRSATAAAVSSEAESIAASAAGEDEKQPDDIAAVSVAAESVSVAAEAK